MLRRGDFGTTGILKRAEEIISDANRGDEVGVRGRNGGILDARGGGLGEGGRLLVVFGDEFVEPIGIGGGGTRGERRRRGGGRQR